MPAYHRRRHREIGLNGAPKRFFSRGLYGAVGLEFIAFRLEGRGTEGITADSDLFETV